MAANLLILIFRITEILKIIVKKFFQLSWFGIVYVPKMGINLEFRQKKDQFKPDLPPSCDREPRLNSGIQHFAYQARNGFAISFTR